MKKGSLERTAKPSMKTSIPGQFVAVDLFCVYSGITRSMTSREEPDEVTHEVEPLQHTIKAFIRRGKKYYVAECLEIAVVTQGKTLDETVENL